MGLIMPTLRLAGAALRNPIGREVAGTAIVGGGIAAAPAVYQASTTGGNKANLRQIIANQDDVDPTKGDLYDINLFDRAKGFLSEITGGKGVTQASLAEQKATDVSRGRDKKFKDTFGRLNISDKYDSNLTEGQLQSLVDQALVDREEKSPAAKRSRAAEAEAQRRFEEARLDRKSDNQIAREDRQAAAQNTLDYNMANLAFQKSNADKQFNLDQQRISRDSQLRHKEKMAQILMGLGGLASAFTI